MRVTTFKNYSVRNPNRQPRHKRRVHRTCSSVFDVVAVATEKDSPACAVCRARLCLRCNTTRTKQSPDRVHAKCHIQKSTTGYFDDFSQGLMWHATYRAREMLMMQEQRLRHTFVLIVFVCHAAFFWRRNVLNSRKYGSTLTTTGSL